LEADEVLGGVSKADQQLFSGPLLCVGVGDILDPAAPPIAVALRDGVPAGR
jgi:hypothetical protein